MQTFMYMHMRMYVYVNIINLCIHVFDCLCLFSSAFVSAFVVAHV